MGKFCYKKGTVLGAKHLSSAIGGAGGGVERQKPKVVVYQAIEGDHCEIKEIKIIEVQEYDYIQE
jgi:hypothetical protein